MVLEQESLIIVIYLSQRLILLKASKLEQLLGHLRRRRQP